MPPDITIEAWTRLSRASEAAKAAVEQALKRAGLPPLLWHDVLLELENGNPAGLRPFELETALTLPQYGVSRLIDRMEKAGYLLKIPCAGDARGQLLVLTEKGRSIRAAMEPVHGAAIEEALGGKLTPGEIRILARIVGKLLPDNGRRA